MAASKLDKVCPYTFRMSLYDLLQESVLRYAKGLVDFVNKGPSPYHGISEIFLLTYVDLIISVVAECKRQLLEKKFVELKEKEPWDVEPGGLVNTACFCLF